MAKAEVQLADEEEKSSPMKWIIIGVVAFVLLAGGVVGTLFALGVIGADPAEAAADAEATAEAPEPEKKEAVYVSIEPPFTVNFQNKSRARFLQISMDVMTRDPAMEEHLKLHMPVIRNDLLMLFSSKNSADLATLEGKQTLQSEALGAVQKVLENETGEKGIESVYFTSFVMQ